MSEPTDDRLQIRVVEPASDEDAIVRFAHPDATSDDLTGAMTGCVVHLCGCDAG